MSSSVVWPMKRQPFVVGLRRSRQLAAAAFAAFFQLNLSLAQDEPAAADVQTEGEAEAGTVEAGQAEGSAEATSDDFEAQVAAEAEAIEEKLDPPPAKPTADRKENEDEGAAEVATEAPFGPLYGDWSEQRNRFYERRPPPDTLLSWAGGVEVDVGYARYTFDNPTLQTETLHDFRGRFVVGPTIYHGFGNDMFVAARGELVAWVREASNQYQVNADDVYATFGQERLWDFKVGRFRMWRVYHRGLGFDLFTVEDVGACRTNPCDLASGVTNFGPDMYEVSYIYDRETPGHAAFHLYPTEWAAIELSGVYGKQSTSNHVGGRGAAVVHFDFLRLSAAAEYRRGEPAQAQTTLDPNGNVVECEDCGDLKRYGYGGGVEVTVDPVYVGLNAAQGHNEQHSVVNGTVEVSASGQTTTMGGFAEVDVGSLLVDRGFILGFGLNRTEVLFDSGTFDQHYQGAAYAVYPLGFNAASVKLVVSRATLETETPNQDGTFTLISSAMNAARVRLTLPFY